MQINLLVQATFILTILSAICPSFMIDCCYLQFCHLLSKHLFSSSC